MPFIPLQNVLKLESMLQNMEIQRYIGTLVQLVHYNFGIITSVHFYFRFFILCVRSVMPMECF